MFHGYSLMMITVFHTHPHTLIDSRPRPLQAYAVAVSRVSLITSYKAVIPRSAICRTGHVVDNTQFVMATPTRSAISGLRYFQQILPVAI